MGSLSSRSLTNLPRHIKLPVPCSHSSKPMKLVNVIVLFFAASLAHAQNLTPQQKQSPPATPRHDVQEVQHGVSVNDPYRWLEDQDSPETRSWITEQNNYTHSLLDRLQGRSALETRLAELKKIEGNPFSIRAEWSFRLPTSQGRSRTIRHLHARRRNWQGAGSARSQSHERRPHHQRGNFRCVEGRQASRLLASNRWEGRNRSSFSRPGYESRTTRRFATCRLF